MYRFLSLSILLSCFFLVWGEVAYFEGRSGDLIYKPSKIGDDSFFFVLDKSGATGDLPETSVADMISHFIGSPVLNAKTSRDNFPKASIFEKDRANLLFVFEDVGSDVIQSLPSLKLLKQSGQRFPLSKIYYPEDQIASLTTLFTGYGPSIHGIVNRYWSTDFGAVYAYMDMDTYSQVPNLADVVNQAFGGRSLIVSASSDLQASAALGVNQHATSLTDNTFGFYWHEESSSYQNLFASRGLSAASNKNSILEVLSKKSFALRHKGDKITYSKESNQIVVQFNGDQVQAVFDLTNNKNDFLFFSELVVIESISQAIQADRFRELIADSAPDLFSFSFSSLEALKSTPQKFQAAMLILDSALSLLISQYQALYDGRIAVEVAFMGVTAYERVHAANANTPLKQNAYAQLQPYITDKQLFDDAFPVMYVPMEHLKTSCQVLSRSNDQTLQLECTSLPDLRQRATATNSGLTEVSPDVAIFQIVLWFSIVLVLTLLAAIYALFAMDVGHQINQFMLPAKTK